MKDDQLSTNYYSAYKDSGIEYLSEIPKKWEIKRIKDVGAIRYGLSQPPKYIEEGLPLIRATNIEKGKVVDKGLVFISPNDVPYNRDLVLVENDVVVVRSGAYTADSAIIPKKYHGAIAGFDMVLRPSKIQAKYLSYALLSNYLLEDQLILSSFRAAQPHLNKEELGTALIVYPSFPEQEAIAHYLDTKTAQIDRKIDLLTQKTTLYSNLKQSLINETVTRGLDKSVAMKDSGIESIRDVPEHWKVIRVKNIVKKVGNGVTPRGGSEVYTDSGVIFLRSQNIYDDGLRIENVSFIPRKIHEEMQSSQLRTGDILINITGASIGRTCLFTLENGSANINQHIAFLRTKFWIDEFYIALFLKSIFIKNYVEVEQNGASKEAFNLNQIANIPVLVPSRSEQKAIADYLDTKTAKIDQITQTIHTQIEKLKELRKTLINDVVTGKIRVIDNGELIMEN